MTVLYLKKTVGQLVDRGELMSYTHKGFWQCMDNKREMELLERLLKNGKAPWKKWKEK